MSNVNAAGTTQNTATLLTGDSWYAVNIPDIMNDYGVRLPSASSLGVGNPIVIWNTTISGFTWNEIYIYPASGESIDGLGTNNPVIMGGGDNIILFYDTSTSWVSMKGIQTQQSYLGDKLPIMRFYVSGNGDFNIDGIGGNSSTIGFGTGTTNTVFFEWKAKNANKVLAGPTTGTDAIPTFRTLVSNDIPNLDAAKITTGTLAVAQGGTNAATTSANNLFAGPTSGGAAAPSFRALVATDIPAITIESGITAAGSTQGTATALAQTSKRMFHEVAAGAAGTGVLLPVGGAGEEHIIRRNAGSLKVYPPNGAQIDGNGANVALAHGANTTLTYFFKDATTIYSTK